MSLTKRYRLWCVTDGKWEYSYGQVAPTACPTDAAHVIDTVKTSGQPHHQARSGLAFYYKHKFSNSAEVHVWHKFGVVPNVIEVLTPAGDPLSTQSITHGETRTTVTFPSPVVGRIMLGISAERVGTIRMSSDGSRWALFVSDDGQLRVVPVPIYYEDQTPQSVELAARKTALTEELRLSIRDFAMKRYSLYHDIKLAQLYTTALAEGAGPRADYIRPLVDWVNDLCIYFSTKATEIALAADEAALDAITWDLSVYDVGGANPDPQVSIITALGIPNPPGAGAYRGVIEKPAPLVAGDIPDGQWVFWRDTSTTPSDMHLKRNQGGILTGVGMSPRA